MRLSLYRSRLLREVEEASALAHDDQNIQPYLSCIAALLRRIMVRTGDHETFIVKEYERDDDGGIKGPQRKSMNLRSLVNMILHYQVFLPTVDWGTLDRTKRTVTILADKEGRIFRRVVDLDGFLGAAKRIATADESILASLLRHARTRLGAVVNGNRDPDDDRVSILAVESLIDVFDLARATKKEDSIEGDIDVRNEVAQNMTEADVRIQSVSYSTLVRNLFNVWFLVPFRQFHGDSKTLDVHDHPRQGVLSITAEDLIDFLNSAQAQWVGGPNRPHLHR